MQQGFWFHIREAFLCLWQGSRAPALPSNLYEQGANIKRTLEKIMATVDDLKKAFTEYQASVEKVMADNKAENDAALAKALEDDEIKDSAALSELADAIKAANDKLVPPPFEPSQN